MALAIFPSLAVAQTAPPPATTTWTDSQGSWFSDGNWDNGQPGSGTDATVDNGGNPQVSGGAASAGVLTIGLGSGVTVGARSSLTISSGQGEGTITLDGGTLQSTAGANGPSISNGIAVTGNGGVIDSAGAHPLIFYGNIVDGATPGTLTFTSSAGRFSDVPNVALYGNNTFSGGAVVEGNVAVQIEADNAIGTGSLEVNAGGAFELGGSSNQSVTTLTGGGAIFATGFGDTTPTLNTLTVADGDFAGQLLNGSSHNPITGVDNTGVLALTKVGNGTLVLSGTTGTDTLAYSGLTSVQGGTLQAGAANTFSPNSTYDVSDATTLDLNGYDQTVGSLTGSGSVTLGAATLTVGRNGQSNTFSGTITGSGGFTLDPSDGYTLALTDDQKNINFNLSGRNTYTGTTTVNVGFLGLVNGGTVADPIQINVSADGSEGGTLVLGSDTAGAAYTLANDVSGQGGILISQTRATFMGDNSGYTGRVQIDGSQTDSFSGALIVGSAQALGSGQNFVDIGLNGELDLNGYNVTVAEIGDGTNFGQNPGNAGTITLNGGQLTLGTNDAGLDYFAGVIRDGATSGGSLHKVGNSTLELLAANSYSGGTLLDAGQITIANGQALGTGTLTMADNTTLAFVSSAGSYLNVTNDVVLNGAATFEADSGDIGALDSTISGGGSLTKTGAGYLLLTGTGTYTGGTTISAGILQIGGGGTTGSISGDVTDAAALIFARSDDVTFGGVVSGTGYVKQALSGVLTLTGANTYSGGTYITGGTIRVTNSTLTAGTIVSSSIGTGQFRFYGGTLQAGAQLTLDNAISVNSNGGTIDNAGQIFTLSGDITSGTTPGLLVFANSVGNGAATILSGNNTYSSGSDITGNVRLGAANALGSGQITLDGTLDLAGFGQTATALTGSGTVVNSGTLAPATLQIGTGGASSTFAGSVTDGSSATALTKVGAGTLVLTGNSSYSGGTTLEEGTIGVGSAAALGTGTLVMDRGTTLSFLMNGLTLANNIDFPDPGDPAIDTGPNFVTMSGTISGPGDLEKLGTGTLDLTGTNTYTGTTTVEQGTLLVDGSIASTTTVNSGAALGGAGAIAGFHVLGGGALAPGAGRSFVTLTATGNAAFDAGSFYRIAINAAGQNDMVAIDGTATLNGGTVEVAATNGNYSSANRYTILTATGGRTGQFSNAMLSSNLAFLTPTLSYGANDVVLGFTQTAGFQSAATTPNQRSVANAVQGLGPGNPVYQALLGQTPAGAQQALQSLSGQAHASTAGVAMSGAHFASRAVFDRFWNIPVDGGGDAVSVLDQFGSTTTPAALRCYTPQQSASDGGFTPANYTVWGQAVGDFGRILGDGNAAAVTSTLGGFAFGLDSKVDAQLFDNWRVGVSAGYTADEFSVAGGGGRGTFQNVFGTLYGGARYGAVDVRLGGSFGGTGTTTDRTVAFPGFVEAEHANYGGSVAQGFGELGYRFALPQTVLEPVVGAGVTAVHEDHYRERGGAAALIGLAEDTTVETTTLGLRSEVTPFAEMPLVARVFLGWQHSYGDLEPATTQAFKSGSAAFSTYGTPLDRDAAVAETAVEYRASNEIKLSLAYSGQIGQRDRDNAVRGRADYRF